MGDLIQRVLASTSMGKHPLRLVTSWKARLRSSRRIFLGHPELGRHLGLSFFSLLVKRLTCSAGRCRFQLIILVRTQDKTSRRRLLDGLYNVGYMAGLSWATYWWRWRREGRSESVDVRPPTGPWSDPGLCRLSRSVAASTGGVRWPGR